MNLAIVATEVDALHRAILDAIDDAESFLESVPDMPVIRAEYQDYLRTIRRIDARLVRWLTKHGYPVTE